MRLSWEAEMVAKTKEQLYLEAQDYLERKIEKLEEEKIRIENEIENTKQLLKTIPDIYESN